MRVFSKAAFLRSETGKMNRHLLKDSLPVLDGMPVEKSPYYEKRGDYIIREYEVNGELYELYPVMPEWTEEILEQTSIFA